jgi:VanZ family protein
VNDFLKYQTPVVVWMVFIYVMSSIPKLPHVPLFFDANTVAHALVFGVLFLLGERAFFYQHRSPILKRNSFWAAFALTCVYGILDEIHQSFVPGRTPDAMDVLADATGAIVMMLVLRLRLGAFSRPTPE